MREGKGSFVTEKGDKFTGDFVGGKKHGKGLLVFSSGSSYDGDWEADMMHGNGIYTYQKTGKKYKVTYNKNQCTDKVPFENDDQAPAPAPAPSDDAPPAVTPTPGAGAETAPVPPPAAAAPAAFPEWLKSIQGIDDEDRKVFMNEKVDEATFLSLSGDDLKVCSALRVRAFSPGAFLLPPHAALLSSVLQELGFKLGVRKKLEKEIETRNNASEAPAAAAAAAT